MGPKACADTRQPHSALVLKRPGNICTRYRVLSEGKDGRCTAQWSCAILWLQRVGKLAFTFTERKKDRKKEGKKERRGRRKEEGKNSHEYTMTYNKYI